MEAQGLSQGSLRNSHRETHAVKRKRAPALFQELARKLVESCSQDLVLRQRLDPERAEAPLRKGTFFALENEGRAEPGFLVFLPGKPAIYLQFRKGVQASTLRMRVSTGVAEGGGTVLIATLDDVLHTLRLEDVWMWRGECLGNQTYTQRREKLKEFVQYHWVPDARLLGGIFTTMAQPMSMEKFAEKKTWDNCHSVEFVPDMPGKRRMIWYLEAQQKAAEAHAGLKQYREPVVTVTATAAPAIAEPTLFRKAKAVAVDKMPDVYDLYGEDGLPIGRASVQQFKLSMILRETKDAWVMAKWRSEFGGYEISGLQ
jgi:hypothetical protein